MSQPTEVQVVPSAICLAGLTNLMATGGPFDTLTLGLFKNNIFLSRATTYANLTPADFAGYAVAAGITFSAAFLDVDGSALAIGADMAFIATGPSPANTIYGYFLANAGLTSLKAAYSFSTPVGINATGQAVVVVPYLRYSGT